MASGGAAAWVCGCGRSNDGDDAFCASCGEPRPAAPTEQARFCAACGAPLADPTAQHCTRCGARVAPGGTAGGRVGHQEGLASSTAVWSAPLASDEPLSSEPARGRGGRPGWIVPVIAGSALVILAACAILIFSSRSGGGSSAATTDSSSLSSSPTGSASSSASTATSAAVASTTPTGASTTAPAALPPIAGYVAGVVAPVDAAGRTVAAALRSGGADQASLALVHRRAATLQAQIGRAREKLKTTPRYQGDDAATIRLLKGALAADGAYASRVRGLAVSPSNVTDEMFSRIADAGRVAHAAYARLATAVPRRLRPGRRRA